MLEECLFIYVSSVSCTAGRKSSPLRACTALPTVMRRDNETRTSNVDFPKGDISADLNRLYINNGTRGMLEGEHFDQLDSVFRFVAAFVDRAEGRNHRHLMISVHTSFSEFWHLLDRIHLRRVQALQALNSTEHHIQNFEELLNDTFDAFRGTGLYILKCHLYDSVTEDLDGFRCLELLSSPT